MVQLRARREEPGCGEGSGDGRAAGDRLPCLAYRERVHDNAYRPQIRFVVVSVFLQDFRRQVVRVA